MSRDAVKERHRERFAQYQHYSKMLMQINRDAEAKFREPPYYLRRKEEQNE